MKILVTGGAGYIGSVVSEELLAAGHTVIAFDNLSQGHREAVHSDVELIVGDLRDEQAVQQAFDAHPGVEAVMHFASFTLVGESMQRPELYLRDNVNAGVTLMAQAVRHGVGRFILSSTANLFDAPDRIPIDEDEAIVPGSPYGESKHILERSLYWYERVHELRYAALRYFNAAGATGRVGESHDPETHIIPLVLRVALKQAEQFTLFGDDYPTEDGSCVRDYIHVVDLARAHILALEALGDGSRVYNLGNGAGFSNKQVIETAEEVTGIAIPHTVGPRRPGDPARLIASSDRIRAELGWEPRYPDLESIIDSAWQWHQKHPNGYE
ncbi:MAG TPA: UDP-glucose 4-epimerase GalE [Chloroflexota bacterium]|jgi:UDP-glucose 4-epimerase|nr:UDP-glucose 4-epimerase GalE [Chloroflexota bacterium]